MSAVLWLQCVACCWPVGSWIGCQSVGAVSHGEEWLRRALSQISRDELRPLAAACGVGDTIQQELAPCSRAAGRVDESLGTIKGGWVRQKWVLIKFVFLWSKLNVRHMV